MEFYYIWVQRIAFVLASQVDGIVDVCCVQFKRRDAHLLGNCLCHFSLAVGKHYDEINLEKKEFLRCLQFQRASP